jgi:hypothetical protein
MKIKLNGAEVTTLKDALAVYMDHMSDLADSDDNNGRTYAAVHSLNAVTDADALIGRLLGVEFGE